MLKIRKHNGNELLSLEIGKGSKCRYTLMQEDCIILKFSLANPVRIPIGAYVVADGFGRFELTESYQPSQNSKTEGWDYEVQFDAHYIKFKNKILKYIPEDGAAEASWSLIATLDVHMSVVLRNLETLGYDYNGTSYSFAIDSTVSNTAKLITYDSINILDALYRMAEEFDCEMWVTDSVIHFGKCEQGEAVEFRQDANVESMTPESNRATYATRLYAFGSDRNLPADYRPTSSPIAVNGVVQKRLMLPEGTPYIDAESGLATEQAVEAVVVFDDIYPRTQSSIGAVSTVQYDEQDEDGNPTGEKWDAYRFTLPSFAFKEEYILEGTDLQAVFQTGLLAGMTFDVKFNPDGAAEDTPSGQVWEIIRSEDYGRPLPDSTLKPSAGDMVVLTGWDSTRIADLGLVANAEQELKERAEQKIAKLKIDPSNYRCRMISASMFDEGGVWHPYTLGSRITLVNEGCFAEGSRASRIIGYEYDLARPFDSPVYIVGEQSRVSKTKEIENKIEALTMAGQTYTGSGNGSGVYIIRTNDTTAPTDTNVYSAMRTKRDFLSRVTADTALGKITFANGLESSQKATLADDTQFGAAFASGITGVGGKIDSHANAELESLFLRRFLEVPELRYNRTTIEIGNQWNAPGGGVIESVEPDTDDDGNTLNTGVITLKLEDGEIGAAALDDLCMGIFHDAVTPSNNAAANTDDSKGNFTFAGFYTSYFRITEILESDNSRFRYALRDYGSGRYSKHPSSMMSFVGYANPTDADRQRCAYRTRTYTRYLRAMTDWEIGSSNIAAQFGDLSNLSLHGLNMSGYSVYLDNVYMRGRIEQLDVEDLRLALDYDNDNFIAADETRSVTATAMRGWTDVTAQVTAWSVTRSTGDAAADAAWNATAKAADFDGTIDLAHTDLGGSASAMFTFTATVEGETLRANLIMRPAPGDALTAPSVTVSGDQMFVYSDNFKGAPVPTSITLKATLKDTTGCQWLYRPQGATDFTAVSDGGATTALTVAAADTAFFPTDVRSCTFRAQSGSVYDELTIAKVSSGSDAVTVMLDNENHTFRGDAEKALAQVLFVHVYAYKGADRKAAEVANVNSDGYITSVPTGMTAKVEPNGTTDTTLNIVVTDALTAKSGVIKLLVVVEGVYYAVTFSWTLSLSLGLTVTEVYAASATTAEPSDSSFAEAIPTTDATNKYLWNAERVDYTDGYSHITRKRIIATYGEKGGIVTVTNYYLASPDDTGVTTATAGWKTDPTQTPIDATNRYLWNYEAVTYTLGDPDTTAPHIVGAYGDGGLTVSVSPESISFRKSDTEAQTQTVWVDVMKGLKAVDATDYTVSVGAVPSGMTKTEPAISGSRWRFGLTLGAGETANANIEVNINCGGATVRRYINVATVLDGESSTVVTVSPSTIAFNTASDADARIWVDAVKGDTSLAEDTYCLQIDAVTGLTLDRSEALGYGGRENGRYFCTLHYTHGNAIDRDLTVTLSVNGETVTRTIRVTTVTDGAPGESVTGEQGLQGCIYRVTEWREGMQYRNDSELKTDGLRYIDIALIPDSSLTTKARAYQATKTHNGVTSSSSNSPTSSAGSTYWTQLNSMSPIYTPLLLADNAVIKLLQSNQVVVMKADGSTVNAAMGGGRYPLWCGAADPTEANFFVDEDGKLKAVDAEISGRVTVGDEEGQRIDIQPDTKAMKVYDEEGNEVAVFSGETYATLRSMFNTDSGSLTMTSANGTAGAVSGSDTEAVIIPRGEVALSSLKAVSVPAEFTVSGRLKVNATANITQAMTPGTDDWPPTAKRAFAQIDLYIYTYADTASDTPIATALVASLSSKATTSSETLDLSGVRVRTARGGYHRLVAVYSTYAIGAYMSASVEWGRRSGAGTNLSATYTTDFYVSRYFANGFCFGSSATSYLGAYRSTAGKLVYEMQNGDMGVRLDEYGVSVKPKNAADYYHLPVFLYSTRIYYNTNWAAASPSWEHAPLGSPTISYTPSTNTVTVTFPSGWSNVITSDNLLASVSDLGGKGGRIKSLSTTAMTLTADSSEGYLLINLQYIP